MEATLSSNSTSHEVLTTHRALRANYSLWFGVTSFGLSSTSTIYTIFKNLFHLN